MPPPCTKSQRQEMPHARHQHHVAYISVLRAATEALPNEKANPLPTSFPTGKTKSHQIPPECRQNIINFRAWMSSHPSKCSISCLEQLCGDESTLIQWHRSAGVPHEINHFSERVNHSCLLLSPPSKQPAAKAASVQERIESKF